MSSRIQIPLLWHVLLNAVCLFTIQTTKAAPLPGGFNHSGWFQFELVVLIDNRSTTLQAENWPISPKVVYPTKWRWLKDFEVFNVLQDKYPLADVSISESGHIMVHHPAPSVPEWIPPITEKINGHFHENDAGNAFKPENKGQVVRLLQNEQGLSIPDKPTKSIAYLDTEYPKNKVPDGTFGAPAQKFQRSIERTVDPYKPLSSSRLPLEHSGSHTENNSLLPIELLDVLPVPPQESSEPVIVPFAAATSTANLPKLRPIKVSVSTIPKPKTFERLPLEQLATGLSRYLAKSKDTPMVSIAWLQNSPNEALPILIEQGDHQDSYPILQGFVQLLPRGETFRLGINLWVNTAGSYLPEFFSMPPPPPSPSRVTKINDIETSTSLKSVLISESDSSNFSSAPPTTDQLVPDAEVWPWKHLIHIADTVVLQEKRIRYFDHPVIKVIATWRELSWYELFMRGVSLAEQRRVVASEVSSNNNYQIDKDLKFKADTTAQQFPLP